MHAEIEALEELRAAADQADAEYREEIRQLEEERDALESEVRILMRLVRRLFWGR
jgi:hypothetical protein